MPRVDRSVRAPERTTPVGDPRTPLNARLEAFGKDAWRVGVSEGMRVPAVVFASEALLERMDEEALHQLRNVAELPGIVEAAYAMPDVHSGYGFPIGGVAATDINAGGVVSPGGVGFDICCGVRLLLTPMTREEIAPYLVALMDELDARVPRGLGHAGSWPLANRSSLESVLRGGVRAAVRAGLAEEPDLVRCEDEGVVEGIDISAVSERAIERGMRQLGSLGSGNHFLELQVVDAIYDEETARAFGLDTAQVCVMIHSGSRGLGHQICSDHVRVMVGSMQRYGISVSDRQLACAPVDSLEGRAYLDAMGAAANYARANRQALTEVARQAFQHAVGTRALELCYDVSHNLAKLERHIVDGEERLLCVHRKGATRAFAPGHPDLPDDLQSPGQPVLVPGSMGTASYVLAGVAPGQAFASACHGAGRTMSRHAAVKSVRADRLQRDLQDRNIVVRGSSARGLAEEAPSAYKDVDEVVTVCAHAGLARRVARLVPIGVVKG